MFCSEGRHSQVLFELSCLNKLVNASLVKLEAVCNILVQVRNVQGKANNVALIGVIALVFIVVDDVGLPFLERGRHVLEVVEVERVRQDVIRVAPLQLFVACNWLGTVESILLAHCHNLHTELVLGVFVLLLRPFAVFFVESNEVVVEILVNVNITDLETREPCGQEIADHSAKDLVQHEEDK